MEEDKAVEELKQTLNILKKAVISEREEKKNIPKTVDALKSSAKELEEKITDRVMTIQNKIIEKLVTKKITIDEDIKKAEERLKSLSKNKAPSVKSSASSRSIMALEQQNEKLMEEFNSLQHENAEDEKKIEKIKK